MKTQLVTGPALNPVSLAEARAHLNLVSAFTTDDTLINAQILTAVEFAENATFRRLVSQTWKLYLDGWAGRDPNRYFPNGFYIPFGQLHASGVVIKYTDVDEDQTIWADTEYDIDTYDEPGAIVLAYNKSFSTVSLYPTNPIEIEFVTGWYQGETWIKETAYSLLDTVVPATQTGFVYECTAAGTSDTTEPTWGKTIAGETADGAGQTKITWTCVGRAVPTTIKQAILLMITEMYSIREVTMLNVSVNKLDTIGNLLRTKTLWEF